MSRAVKTFLAVLFVGLMSGFFASYLNPGTATPVGLLMAIATLGYCVVEAIENKPL